MIGDEQPNGSVDKADAELAAMSAIRKALADLEDDSRQRVLDWVSDFYGYSGRRRTPPADQGSRAGQITPPVPNGDGGQGNEQQFPDFAALHHAANPTTDAERALVGGYWFQVAQGNADFGSREVNKALNNLGFRVGNITSALTTVMSQRPQPVIQVGKAGKAQQANKRYRVTDEGIRRVRQMLTAEQE
jgi:hypothetical protein